MSGRIRTIKPEFFRSPDTARVSFPGRIFYEALWCWADDFGVGETNINGLLGFAFCDTDEVWDEELRTFRAISAQDLRGFCAEVALNFGVTFYSVRGRHYYAIPSWSEHQKLEKRTDRRKHPLPDDPDAIPDLRFHPPQESAPEDPRKSGAESAHFRAGTGEQGNRGTGEREQGNRDTNTPAPPAPAPAASDGQGEVVDIVGSKVVRAKRPTEDTDENFAEWWATYPRRQSKAKARESWSKALSRGVSAERLLAGAARYRDDPNRLDQFTKAPPAWLNQGCWDDDPLPGRNGNGDGFLRGSQIASAIAGMSRPSEDPRDTGIGGQRSIGAGR